MKYALVTGGSRGIGWAVCLKLAQMQYHVLLNYRNNDTEAEHTKALVEQAGVSCVLMKFDVTIKEDVEAVLGGWLKKNTDKAVQVLVNNAGSRQDNLFMWMSEEQWKDVISTSLDSFYYVTRLVVTDMMAKRFGRVISIASLSGLKGVAGQTNYSAAKGGLIGASKALAQEVARRGVTVNVVAPGFIKTDMTADLDEKKLSEMIPMRRFGSAEEVADVVGFLASPGASYITAEVININGGIYS